MSVGLEAYYTEHGVPGLSNVINKSYEALPCEPGFRNATQTTSYPPKDVCCAIKKVPKVSKRCDTCFENEGDVIKDKDESGGKGFKIGVQIGSEDEDKKGKVEYEEVLDMDNCVDRKETYYCPADTHECNETDCCPIGAECYTTGVTECYKDPES